MKLWKEAKKKKNHKNISEDELFEFATENGASQMLLVENTVLPENKSAIINDVAPDFNIYPNPTDGIINITGKKLYKIEIFTTNGQKILSRKLNNSDDNVDLSTYNSGIYILRIHSNDKIHYRKIMKNN